MRPPGVKRRASRSSLIAFPEPSVNKWLSFVLNEGYEQCTMDVTDMSWGRDSFDPSCYFFYDSSYIQYTIHLDLTEIRIDKRTIAITGLRSELSKYSLKYTISETTYSIYVHYCTLYRRTRVKVAVFYKRLRIKLIWQISCICISAEFTLRATRTSRSWLQ